MASRRTTGKSVKIEITISQDLYETLLLLAEENTQSLSSTAADCLKSGVFSEAESRNKLEVWKKLVRERQKREQENQENQANEPQQAPEH